MIFDPDVVHLIWSVTTTIIAGLAAFYAWQVKRTGANTSAIDGLDRRLIRVEEQAKAFAYRSEVTEMAATLKGFGNALTRIETQVGQITESLLSGRGEK